MKRTIHTFEKGQSLMIVAVLMIVFIGMLAFAIDGGFSYANRRAAQTAADAGALAGARELCVTGDPDLAVARALDYAVNHNRAITANATVDSGEVTVEAYIPFQTFFARLLGRPNITAAAIAAAGCFAPGAGTGILPIAWSCRPPVAGGSDSDDCEMQYREGDTCSLAEGDPMYLIVDSPTIADDVLCQDPPNSGTPAGALDCDVVGGVPAGTDGIDDLDLISGGNRSWLDLSGGGGGASDLSNWIRYGYPADVYNHTWFAGQTGVAVSVYNTVANYRLNQVVAIPVFDQYCGGKPMATCPSLVHSEDTIVLSGGTSTDYFHIISFAGFHITCVNAGSHGPCPVQQAVKLKPNVKSIEGCFVEGYIPGLKGKPGDGIDAGAWTLYLTR